MDRQAPNSTISDSHSVPSTDSERIDKWLHYACLYKTRSQATKACDERQVKVNNQVVKPSKMIKTGDQVTLKRKGGQYVNLLIVGIVHRNISRDQAQLLYEKEVLKISEETQEIRALLQQSARQIKPKYKGRPTKKERRKYENLKSNFRP